MNLLEIYCYITNKGLERIQLYLFLVDFDSPYIKESLFSAKKRYNSLFTYYLSEFAVERMFSIVIL